MASKGKKIQGEEASIERLKKWCARQDRSLLETRRKLDELALNDALITELVEEGFLDERRFAFQYAGGHFRSKQWGRLKIREGLEMHEVPTDIIEEALGVIHPDEYELAVKNLVQKKIRLDVKTDKNAKYRSVLAFLISKGFEEELVTKHLNILLGETDSYEFRS